MIDDIIPAPHWIGKLPGRINSKQVGALLGFTEFEVRCLVSANHLKPLGNPSGRAVKYFQTAEIIELVHNKSWYERATRLAYTGNRTKSKRSKGRLAA